MIGVRALRASRHGKELVSGQGRDLARLLALLEADHAQTVTFAELRERGIEAPGQAIYMLQLDGYQIDRVPVQRSDGHKTIGYRLPAAPSGPIGRSAQKAEDDAL